MEFLFCNDERGTYDKGYMEKGKTSILPYEDLVISTLVRKLRVIQRQTDISVTPVGRVGLGNGKNYGKGKQLFRYGKRRGGHHDGGWIEGINEKKVKNSTEDMVVNYRRTCQTEVQCQFFTVYLANKRKRQERRRKGRKKAGDNKEH